MPQRKVPFLGVIQADTNLAVSFLPGRTCNANNMIQCHLEG